MIITFVAQASLAAIYLTTLFKAEKPDFTNIEAFLYYGLGALVQIAYTSRIDYLFGYDGFWLECRLQFKDYCDRMLEEEEILLLRKHLLFRRTASILINVVARDLIILLLPLHLARSEQAMDFVLNAVAAYFIIELDNLDGESFEIKDWDKEFEKLQQFNAISGSKSEGDAANSTKDGNSDVEDQSDRPHQEGNNKNEQTTLLSSRKMQRGIWKMATVP